MVDLPKVSNSIVTSTAPTSSVSRSDIQGNADLMANALGKVADAGMDIATDMAKKQAADDLQNQKVTLNADGSVNVVNPANSVIFGRAGEAYHNAVQAGTIAQHSNVVSQELNDIHQKYPTDPAGFKTAADAWKAQYLSQHGGGEVGQAISQQADQLQTQHLNAITNTTASNDIDNQKKSITATIEDQKNTAIALARQGGTDTPEFKQAIGRMNASYDALGTNPLFKTPADQIEIEKKNTASLLQGEALVQHVDDTYNKRGKAQASEELKSLLTNPNLREVDRSRLYTQGMARLGYLTWDAKLTADANRQITTQLEEGLAKGTVKPEDPAVGLAVHRSRDIGDTEGAQRITAAAAVAQHLRGVSVLPDDVKSDLLLSGPKVDPDRMQAAILGQESGNRSNIGNSIDGARGPGQIMPATFAQYAKPGERIDNPDDNRAVNARILADYSQRYNGDPARIAVAYFSGPGNVAPPGSPTPYLRDARDGNGKSTSSYVSDVMKRLDNGGGNLLDQARAQYPILKNYDYGYTENFRPNGGFLEHWDPGEQGVNGGPNSLDGLRPANLPLDKHGLEIRDPNTRPIDILGDIASHHLVNVDPVVKQAYEKLQNSMTPAQQDILKDQYEYAKKNEGETGSFDDWKKRAGMPGFFRGYLFQQWPKDFNDKAYTPEQRADLDKVMDYLKAGAKPQLAAPSANGRGGFTYQQVQQNPFLLSAYVRTLAQDPELRVQSAKQTAEASIKSLDNGILPSPGAYAEVRQAADLYPEKMGKVADDLQGRLIDAQKILQVPEEQRSQLIEAYKRAADGADVHHMNVANAALDQIQKQTKNLQDHPYQEAAQRGWTAGPPAPIDPAQPEGIAPALVQRATLGDRIGGLNHTPPPPILDKDEVPKLQASLQGPQGAAVLSQIAQGLRPEEMQRLIDGDGFKDSVTAMSRSGDPVKMNAAYSFMDTQQRQNPLQFDRQFPEGLKDLRAWQGNLAFYPPDEAAKRLMRQYDPAQSTAMKAADEVADKALKNVSAAQVVSKFSTGFGPFGTGARTPTGMDAGVAAGALKADYDMNYRDGYAATGDASAADKFALEKLQLKYAVSPTNGNRVMANAPERYYPMVGGSHDWMGVQLDQAIKQTVTATGGGAERFEGMRTSPKQGPRFAAPTELSTIGSRQYDATRSIVADRNTEADIAAGKPPSYQIILQDGNGRWSALQDARGNTQRIRFDPTQPFAEHARRAEAARSMLPEQGGIAGAVTTP